jgi:CHASE2 domain-containing sensor protein
MKKSDDVALTSIIGSTGALLGAAGVTLFANAAAPAVATIATALGTAIASAALYRKISHQEKPDSPKSSHQLTRRGARAR